jgi:hypothetical protein
MEYPMICWNYGRPDENGVLSERKNGMVGVTIHEVGHNFFPMIVNSDERQWSWMDEGLNTLCSIWLSKKWEQIFLPVAVQQARLSLVTSDQKFWNPCLTSETIVQFGSNALW